ncbi:ROK family transcriptional regulator [Streptomyces sp. ST1015]|uniref:ROK family transcriptional regulator n=3 Tax=Streptomyces TaxID=1883 RepID=UPI001CA6C1EF|nr:ROK family transcriptional regulator [Streptomyces sp. ST1015]QZZ25915.1 ROK family transcriptional regulator [Streptomyces sp. ST1015]
MQHLSESAGAVFAVLAEAGDATRPRLAQLAGLSKPTVSSAVAELESAGLASRTGTTSGTTGRSAAVYRIGPAAGTVLAVDLGSTHTAVRACTLDGTVVASHTARDRELPAETVRGALWGLAREELGPVRGVVVAVPDVVRPGGGAGDGGGAGAASGRGAAGRRGAAGGHGAAGGRGGASGHGAGLRNDDRTAPASGSATGPAPGASHASGTRSWGASHASDTHAWGARPATPSIAAAVDALALPSHLPVHIENNVNCAALAELHEGAAKGRHTFGYLQVGYGIGLGIVVGGQVLRGAGGAAGEIARLPYPWLPGRESVLEGMEAYVGAGALMRRVREGWTEGRVPEGAAELFALAGNGHEAAARFVAGHAREVGRLAAAAVAVLDPGLIVLGGGIGANPQLLPGVRAELARLSWPTEVVGSEVGGDATVAGAARLAVARGIQTVTEGSDKRH